MNIYIWLIAKSILLQYISLNLSEKLLYIQSILISYYCSSERGNFVCVDLTTQTEMMIFGLTAS